MREKKPLFHYLKGSAFFEDYVTNVNNFRNKMRGKSGRNQPLEFSKEDREEIKKAVIKMLEDFEKRDIEDLF